jgi:hypothetical protein
MTSSPNMASPRLRLHRCSTPNKQAHRERRGGDSEHLIHCRKVAFFDTLRGRALARADSTEKRRDLHSGLHTSTDTKYKLLIIILMRVDHLDSKSRARQRACGFDPLLQHQHSKGAARAWRNGRRGGLRLDLSDRRETGDAELLKVEETCSMAIPSQARNDASGRCRN